MINSSFVDIGDDMVEIPAASGMHKYLGGKNVKR